jgi:hypothetical protein
MLPQVRSGTVRGLAVGKSFACCTRNTYHRRNRARIRSFDMVGSICVSKNSDRDYLQASRRSGGCACASVGHGKVRGDRCVRHHCHTRPVCFFGATWRSGAIVKEAAIRLSVAQDNQLRGFFSSTCSGGLTEQVCRFELFLCLDARVVDNLGPFDDIRLDDGRELLGRTTDRIEA